MTNPNPSQDRVEELRYRVESRSHDAIVFDCQRSEIFCVIPQSIMWTGHDGAEARAKDIAELFNKANTHPESEAVTVMDPDVERRLESVANTLETCGKHGIPIDFAMLAHDIREALARIGRS